MMCHEKNLGILKFKFYKVGRGEESISYGFPRSVCDYFIMYYKL